MKQIDLHDYYPNHPAGSFVEVEEEVAAAMKPHRVEDATHERRMRRNKVYSLDAYDGIENDMLDFPPTLEDAFLRKVSREQLQEALVHIPPKQARRVHAKYILGQRCSAIAREEGVSRSCVAGSVAAGLRNLKRYYEQRKWLP